MPVPPSSDDATWSRIRRALDGFPAAMTGFLHEVYGPGALHEAWDHFTLWDQDADVFDPNSAEMQVFLPWCFHCWEPDLSESWIADSSLAGVPPTRALLDRRGRRLDPILRAYLEGCLAAPFSFHEVVRTDPDRGFRARNVMTGEELEVMERSASQTLKVGDVVFGQMVTAHGISMMEACSPLALNPENKLAIIDLRDRMAGGAPTLSVEELRGWSMEMLDAYWKLLVAVMDPPRPLLRNTDGERIVFHTLTFRIPSPESAFEALKSLAFDESDLELLDTALFDNEGRLKSVSITWKGPANPAHKQWSNTILGHIGIRGDRLVADLNSAERAKLFMERISGLYPEARHTGTEVRRNGPGAEIEDLEPADLSDLPVLQELIRSILTEHYEGWPDESLPALGGRSPREAVKERSGREKVEALIAQLERDGQSASPPLDPSIPRMIRERLGLLT